MRTTVTLDPDVAAAVSRVRKERGVGVSQAINDLARAGLAVRAPRKPFRQRTSELALRIDVTNIAEALEQLDGPGER